MSDTEENETYFRTAMPNGVPLFIVRDESAMEEIDALGIPVCYILAAKKFDNGESPLNKYKYEEWTEPVIFKRINVAMGHGLLVQKDAGRMPLATLKDAAFWTLPPIPRSMVDTIDSFFRAVYDKHKSESIVILTYDPEFKDVEGLDPSDGWGFLVPDQTNSGSSCKYEPESIVDEKPEHVLIVGSAHSHPNMSAFASHTDVGDQMDFDGLHITYGWQNSKGGRTEYHIEYQLNNQRFAFSPDQVYQEVPPEDFSELDELVAKVKKAAPPAKPPYTSSSTTTVGKSTVGGSKSEPSAASAFGNYFREKFNTSRPNGCPDLVKNTVVVSFRLEDRECPICEQDLTEYGKKHRRCTNCFTYLAASGEAPADIVDIRKKSYSDVPYAPGLEYAFGKTSKERVLLWSPGPEAAGHGTMQILFEPTLVASGKA